MIVDLQNLHIGYVPYNSTLEMPGDRRRFVHYARSRGLNFELADPERCYDVVVLSERADISTWSRYDKGKLVYDLIDSYLAIHKTCWKSQLRGLAKFIYRQSRYLQFDYRKAVKNMCRNSNAVVCTTEEQRREIRQFCPNVHIVLDAQSMVSGTAVKTDFTPSETFRLVWEGLPANVRTLTALTPMLRRLQEKYALELHLITDATYPAYLGRYGWRDTWREARSLFNDVILHEWNESTCADIIKSCDLAVIPLDLDDPFAAGKPENKLLLFWRIGMPTVVSATPAYVRAMQGAGLSMMCSNESEWFETLERYMLNKALREEAGVKGRTYAEVSFSESTILESWDNVFFSLYGNSA